VLLRDRDGTIVGAAHAGWRGLAAGVLPALVNAMRRRRPGAELMAWLGPRLGRAHFEVGGEVRAAFLARLPAVQAQFLPSCRPGHWYCDLGAIALYDLAQCDVALIADSGLCTQADGSRFWSHRRDQPGGRMAALIRRS